MAEPLISSDISSSFSLRYHQRATSPRSYTDHSWSLRLIQLCTIFNAWTRNVRFLRRFCLLQLLACHLSSVELRGTNTLYTTGSKPIHQTALEQWRRQTGESGSQLMYENLITLVFASDYIFDSSDPCLYIY